MDLLAQITETLQQGRAKEVQDLVGAALAEGIGADRILQEGLLAGMMILGEKFRRNEVYVPDVLIASRAMNAGIEILRPHLAAAGTQSIGKVVLGTVQGDLHDIGKNLVKIMFQGAGFDVIDLGVDVSAQRFVEAVRAEKARILAMSALLTTTMVYMKQVIEAVEKAGLRDQVIIMVGGAPITESYAASIGADLYAPDAASAAQLARERIA